MTESLFRRLVSVRVAVWLLLALGVLLALGALIMPGRPATYSGINDQLLFSWLGTAGKAPDNFWFWGALSVLGLLVLHTVTCTVDALFRMGAGRGLVLRLAPHVMHLGFLLILLGHLLSAGWGFRHGGTFPRGAYGRLPDGSTLLLRTVDMKMDASGFPRDWWADVTLFHGGAVAAEGRLAANKPLFHKGVGIYLKTLSMTRMGPAAQIMVNRDPGAPWVLAGALVFTLGNGLLLVLKIRREAPA